MEILKHIKTGRLIAFDQDEDVAVNVPDDSRFTLLYQNFRFLKNNLRFIGVDSIDGLIADLGVSFHQFDVPERGFTFRQDAPLDMRMNKSGRITAADILNNMNETELADMFFHNGELRDSRKIAREIVAARTLRQFRTVNDLIEVVGRLAPYKQENKFYARIFQSLRIAVNREIANLKDMLVQAGEMLKPGGRLAIISYHSLEDRIVKNYFRTGNFEGNEEKDFYGNIVSPFKIITKKGIVPEPTEVEENSRSRSARLRIAEKI